VITELDRGALIRLDQLPEQRSPLHEWPAAQILAVKVQEIEGKKHDPVRCLVDDRAQGKKVGDAVLVLDGHLTIDQSRFAGQPGAILDHPPIGSRPVIPVPGEGADLAAIDNDQGAIAVIFDVVNPAIPGRRLQNRKYVRAVDLYLGID
jgi:hypothetical protein